MAAPAPGTPEHFQLTIDRVAQHLESDDAQAVAAATVTLTLMLQSTQLPSDLAVVAARLAALLEAGAADAAVQRNAAAGLSACLEASDSAVEAAIENRAVRRGLWPVLPGLPPLPGATAGSVTMP